MDLSWSDAPIRRSAATYGPLTKSVNIDQTLMLIQLSREYESVAVWQDEALFRLPQASRVRRQEIVRSALRKFLEVKDDHFVETPLRTLLTTPSLGPRMKRDLLLAQYLRTTPLVWEAIRDVALPHAKAAVGPMRGSEDALIAMDEWMAFLKGKLNTRTSSTVSKTRKHITGHLTKFALLNAQPIPGESYAKRFFAQYYEPEPGAFWFSLAKEFEKQGWASRSLNFVANQSWTRIAYCTTPSYARFVMGEAERAGVALTEYFGSEKQMTLRGADPQGTVVEAIIHG